MRLGEPRSELGGRGGDHEGARGGDAVVPRAGKSRFARLRNWPDLGGTDNRLGKWSGECANALSSTATGWGPQRTEPGELLHKTTFLDGYVKAKGWKLGPIAAADRDNNGCMKLEGRDGLVEKVTTAETSRSSGTAGRASRTRATCSSRSKSTARLP